jgi:hypothetical protein
MKYKITENRANFLREKFFEYSFKEINLDVETLNNISEPIELDFIAKNHNYDDGNDILINIINNSNCDLSTVKMIFYRSDVEGFLTNNQSIEDFLLISNIIENCNKDFYKFERFYYNPNDDSYILDFDLDSSNHIIPNILFSKPKGRKIEPNFAEFFYQRRISKNSTNIEISSNSIIINTEDSFFKYSFPDTFELVDEEVINQFIENYNFPKTLKSNFSITEKQLKKVLINPQIVLRNENTLIILFVFNAKPLRLENAITNVATILRNEISNIQAFFQITSVEENFDKIRRIKSNENWFALSKGMQVKLENFQEIKYLKILITEKDDLLFYYTIFSNSIENLDDENIQELIINHIKVQ